MNPIKNGMSIAATAAMLALSVTASTPALAKLQGYIGLQVRQS